MTTNFTIWRTKAKVMKKFICFVYHYHAVISPSFTGVGRYYGTYDIIVRDNRGCTKMFCFTRHFLPLPYLQYILFTVKADN